MDQAHQDEFFLITLSLRVQAIRSFETTHRYLAEDLKIPRTSRLGKQLACGKTEHEEEGITVTFLKYEIRLQE